MGYACSLTHDVDEHSSLPPCTPLTCEDFLGQCGKFTDPCSGVEHDCICPDPEVRKCTLLDPEPDAGADAGGDAAPVSAPNSAPTGYCDCQGATGCITRFALAEPSKGSQVAQGGAQEWKDWTEAGNVAEGVAGCARVELEPNDGKSEYLRATGFDFSAIPDGSCIVGIEVWIDRRADRPTVYDHWVALIKGGVVQDCQACNLAKDTRWPTTPASEQYGTCEHHWGGSWNAVDLKVPDFGVAIRARSEASRDLTTARVCRVRMQVHYTLPGCSTSCP
jgi:hypothetical protein